MHVLRHGRHHRQALPDPRTASRWSATTSRSPATSASARAAGFPLKIQSIHMIEIGAGGGCIAARNRLGLLEVGPHSAGAVPGPACYGRGGTEADRHRCRHAARLYRRRLLPRRRLRSSTPARRAPRWPNWRTSLGVTPERCAWGIHDLVNEYHGEAAAMHATDHGVDPRTLPLIAFGGAGPVHAYGVARKLGIRKVDLPDRRGRHLGDRPADCAGRGRSVRQPADAARSLGRRGGARCLRPSWRRRAARSCWQAEVHADGISDARTPSTCAMSARATRSRVALPRLDSGADAVSSMSCLPRFQANYTALFGRTVADSPLEVITWRLRASGPKGRGPRPARRPSGDADRTR